MKIYKTAIIGGGASGLFCAIELLRGDNAINPSDIIILEKNDRLGKKLSATGNGQGNVLNKDFCSKHYHGEKSFVNTLIGNIDSLSLKDYLYSIGIPCFYDEEGRGYPLSKQANSVTDAFRFFVEKVGVEIRTSCPVKDVKYNGENFEINGENCKIMAQTAVLASGGKASRQFGTDGQLYQVATAFGHELSKIYPSLVQIKTQTDKIKGLKNLKETARVCALYKGESSPSFLGDLLFTDYGVSGSAIFKLSPYISGKENVEIKIEFLPDFSEEETEKLLEDKIKNYPIKEKEEILSGIINKKIGQTIIRSLSDCSPKTITKALKNFSLKVTGTMGFDYAQVTKGGIITEKINPITLESKLRRGLYLIGEILDVDGDCGGFNLMLAFGTGVLASKHIKQRFSK